MDESFYARPDPFSWTPVVPRALLPIYPPPEPLQQPPLPSPPRQCEFSTDFVLSTHLFPAAYLRTTRQKPVPPPPAKTATKAEREALYVDMRDVLMQGRARESDGYPQVLWNCATRYVRGQVAGSAKNGLTLFFAHANGFPKEIWEPVIARLLTSPAGPLVDEVWTWESVQHGDAGVVNQNQLSSEFDWADNARDILNFLIYFLPPATCYADLPTHLNRLPLRLAERRRAHGFEDRQLVVVGHSYGGCTSALAASVSPKLFSSLVLVDPVLCEPGAQSDNASKLTLGALMRRDTWHSKKEALEGFKNSPFFGGWDRKVLELYVEHGIYLTRDDSGKEVAKLKTTSFQEAILFAGTHASQEVYQLIPDTDSRIALRWIMPGRPGAHEFGPTGAAQRRVWLRPNNSSNVRIMGAGHLIPQEKPYELAEDLSNFIITHYGTVVRT